MYFNRLEYENGNVVHPFYHCPIHYFSFYYCVYRYCHIKRHLYSQMFFIIKMLLLSRGQITGSISKTFYCGYVHIYISNGFTFSTLVAPVLEYWPLLEYFGTSTCISIHIYISNWFTSRTLEAPVLEYCPLLKLYPLEQMFYSVNTCFVNIT